MTEPRYTASPFVPAAGLANPHAQTIFAALMRPRARPVMRRERWDTPDGDFVDVDLLDASSGAPHVVVLHGLEGSSDAGYVAGILREAHARQWGALALSFRSCSGEMNRLARSYHSGETGDLSYVIGCLRRRASGPLLAVGFSLGGNVLLRLLEETGDAAPIHAAVAISAPFDLAASARALDSGVGLLAVYRYRFLRTMKRKALEKALRHPGLIDEARLRRVRGIAELDDIVTAPLHGFSGVSDYYTRCSSGPELRAIRRPTLLLSAADDPMVPMSSLPRAGSLGPHVTIHVTSYGGHVGFVCGNPVRPQFWAEREAGRYLASTVG